MRHIQIFLILFLLSSCDEPFHGARIYGNLDPGTTDAETLVTPTRVRNGATFTYLDPADQGYVHHYELHAGIEGQGTVRLFNFQVRPIMEIHHPCMAFIDDELNANGTDQFLNMCQSPYPDMERYVFVLTAIPPSDASDDENPGYNFLSWVDAKNLLHADNTTLTPSCTTDASGTYTNKMHYDEAATKAFCENLHPDYYLGNPFQISKPINGRIFGYIDGPDPRTSVRMGGIALNIAYKLNGATDFFITAEPDASRVTKENMNLNLPMGENARVILISELDGHFGYLDKDSFEGVWHGLMVDPAGSNMRLEFTLYNDFDKDTVLF